MHRSDFLQGRSGVDVRLLFHVTRFTCCKAYIFVMHIHELELQFIINVNQLLDISMVKGTHLHFASNDISIKTWVLISTFLYDLKVKLIHAPQLLTHRRRKARDIPS